MADESSEPEIERQIRELYRGFAEEPLPEPLVSDEDLVAILRARLRQKRAADDDACADPFDAADEESA